MHKQKITKKNYKDITKEEWAELKKWWVINWCWPKGWFIKPPYAIFFKASCDFHDLSYYNWWTEEDRLRADKWFLRNMMIDCEKERWLRRYYFFIWTYVYYFAVRLFWKKYFNYK